MLLSGFIPDIPLNELGIALASLSGVSLAAFVWYSLRRRMYRRRPVMFNGLIRLGIHV